MNKKMVLAAFSIVALSATMAFGLTAPRGGVPGSIHDMNLYSGTTPDSQGRVCAFCHTPHHAITDGNDYLPLWSHQVTSTTFTPYASATLDATIDPTTMMEGPSKLCMSCHDGSIAVDTHYAFTGTKTLQQDDSLFSTPAVGKGGGLNNDHPIGFVYDNTQGGVAKGPAAGDPAIGTHTQGADEYIRTFTATYNGNPGLAIKDRLYASASQGGNLIMTCATCHDVHNKKNQDAVGSTNYLLLAPNTGSQLCLTCHIK